MVLTNKRIMAKNGAKALLIVSVVFMAGAIGCKQKTGSTPANVESPAQVTVTQDPAKAKEHFEKGVNHSMKKEYDMAILEYSESIKYNPGVAAAHSNLAFAYADSGNVEMAVTEHKRALEIDPTHSNSHYGMAMIYEAMGNKAEAVKSWEDFMKLTEPNSPWWNKAKEKLEKLKGGAKSKEQRS